ncbi:DUF1636 domain-containing protein [Methylobrevis albus]|nr:DUF1636 domain-containing protein [Methylobrevis albus]
MDRADPTDVTLFVCTTCRRAIGESGDFERPGEPLHAALADRLAGVAGIAVTATECLSVCKRPGTIALSGGRRWTYVIGDLDLAAHLDEIVAGALAYREAPDGIVPWRERPQCFKKGVVARIPPSPLGVADVRAAPVSSSTAPSEAAE